jgi:hypothetical protein
MRNARLAERLLGVAIIALAATHIVLYLAVALRTIRYPYPLEWMEGGSIDVIARVRAGLPIYARPTASYVPYIYAPLYYIVSSLASRLVGLGFFAGRLVSFLATCGSCALIYGFIRREGADISAALTGVGIFLSTYDASGRWFHLARVDALFLLLLLAASYALRFVPGWRGAIVAAVLFWLAFLTKQIGLSVAAVMLAFVAIAALRRALGAGALLGTLLLATNVVMDSLTHRWWHYFIYTLPAKHQLDFSLLVDFWRTDVGTHLPLAVGGAIALLVCARDRAQRWFYAGLIAGFSGASCAARVHTGGWLNDVIPAFAVLALAMPIGIALAFHQGTARTFGRIVLIAQLAWPLAALPRALHHVIPSAADRAAADRYVALLKGIDGQVIIWNQRFVETRAGKNSWGLEMAATDILRSNDTSMAAALKQDVIDACRRRDVAGVIEPPDWLRTAVPFASPVMLFDDPRVFVPVTGRPERPSRYYPILRP